MKIDIPSVNENPTDADVHFLEDRITDYNVETTGINAVVRRAQIVLLSVQGESNREVARRCGLPARFSGAA